jgi:large subunit ribosomal protein L21
MEAYAVMETGGKQYLVRENDKLAVELLDAEPGTQVKIESVLALSDGKALQVGTPSVAGAAITTTVVEHIRGPKLISFKKKRRKGYTRKVGHRQDLTVIKIDKIA